MYRYLDHTADIIIFSQEENLENLFKTCAIALINLIYDIENINKYKKIIKYKYIDNSIDNLLYLFLNDLIYNFEKEKLIFYDFIVKVQPREDNYILTGEYKAAGYNKDNIKNSLKAVTFSNLRIEKKNNKYQVYITVDV